MVVVELSDEERDYLDDILTFWLDGCEEAQAEVLSDPLINSFEDLMGSSSDLRRQEEIAKNIRGKLHD